MPEALLLLYLDFIAVLARPFDGAVRGAAVYDNDLVDPGSINRRHDGFHAIDFVQRHHKQCRFRTSPVFPSDSRCESQCDEQGDGRGKQEDFSDDFFDFDLIGHEGLQRVTEIGHGNGRRQDEDERDP